jgi:Fis family transcriptional regulator, factor for inversion stimulation protein
MIVNGRKATRAARREIVLRPPPRGAMKDTPLREHAETALHAYFEKLNGHRPARLYDLVLREVEEPLFRAVMSYATATRAGRPRSSASTAARCARSCAGSP